MTLPADPLPAIGRLHLITQTRREIEDVFIGLGFKVAEGPEVETVYYNFDALNHDATHPARAWTDTFYVARRRAAAHSHEPDADPLDGAAEAADLPDRPGPRVPP